MGRSPVKRVLGTLLFVVALIGVAAFSFLLFAESEGLSVPGTDQIPEIAAVVAIFLGVVILLLILLLVVRRLDDREKEAEDAEAFFIPDADREEQAEDNAAAFDEAFGAPTVVPTPAAEPSLPDVVVYDLFRLPVARRAWAHDGGRHNFYFPRSVEGGVYVNDYVEFAPGQSLKLRTLLAGPRDIPLTDDEPYVVPASDSTGPAPVEELTSPGDDFMRELESRYTSLKDKDTGDYEGYESLNGHEEAAAPAPIEPVLTEAEETVEPTAEVFYDFGGDIHDVIDVEGIGPVYAQRLQQAGIHSTARLCYADPDEIAAAIDAPAKTVRSWQNMAQLMKVTGIGPQYAEVLARAGIDGIDELKRRSPSRIAEQINEYVDSLETNVLGTRITERRVTGWQEAAKTMRRVRQKVPAQ